MSRQLLVVFAVLQQLGRGHIAVEHAEQVLRRDAVPGFIEEDRNDRRAVGDEGADYHDLRHRVVRAAGVPAETLGIGDGREEDDRVAAELDIVQKRRFLLGGESEFRGIEL